MRKKAVMSLMEKIRLLDKICSGMSYNAFGCELMLTNQQHILHKAALTGMQVKQGYILKIS